MFSHLGFGEILVIAVVGFFVFGPDRLPKAAAEAGRMLRQLKQMATQARTDLKSELGPELANVPIRSLNPRRMVKDLLLAEEGAGVAGAGAAAVGTAEASSPAPNGNGITPGGSA
jgi:sec-independent protein translocase protein TatB